MAIGKTTQYKGKNDYAGPSDRVWGDCPILEMKQDGNVGVFYRDDFLNFSQHISDQSTQQYDSYIDTGVTIKQLAGTAGAGFGATDGLGVIEIAGNDADNDEGVLSGHGPMVQISDTAGHARKLWAEFRWQKASVADNALATFIGLAFDHGNGVPVAKTLCLTDDDGALGAFSYVGFHVDQADGDALDFVYKADGQSAVVKIAGVQVLEAATWYKLGFVFDPAAIDEEKIAVYVDGVKQTTFVTATNIATNTFPDAEPLAPVWCAKVGAASEIKSQLDWWQIAQLRSA